MNGSSRLFIGSIVLFTLAYTILVLTGCISKDNRIDVVHFGLIAASALGVIYHFHPKVFEELKIFEFGNLKMEFERVKRQQEKQEDLLDSIRVLLPLILPSNEIEHLRNLLNDNTRDYRGGGTLRSEIRRLRSRKLIGTRSGKSASDLEGGKTFDLADYAYITELGKHWLERIEKLEQLDSNSLEKN